MHQIQSVFVIFVDFENASLKEVLARVRHIYLNSAADYNFSIMETCEDSEKEIFGYVKHSIGDTSLDIRVLGDLAELRFHLINDVLELEIERSWDGINLGLIELGVTIGTRYQCVF